ncbi:MAG: phosphonate ABC transporter, permease protein PhnE [bacterium]
MKPDRARIVAINVAVVAVVVLFVYGAQLTEFNPVTLAKGLPSLWNLVKEFIRPDLSAAWVRTALAGMGLTLVMAALGTAVAVVISFPLSFLGARNVVGNHPAGRAVYWFVRGIFNLFRTLDTMVLAIVFVAAVGIGAFPGVLAIIVHSIGYLGKLFSEAIEEADAGIIEAVEATGASPLQVIRFGILPQVSPYFLGFTLFRMDANVRMSTVLGLVGAGGIGYYLREQIQLFEYAKAGTILWEIGLVVAAFDALSAYVRHRMR